MSTALQEKEERARRIETKISKTALMVCITRAASYFDNHELYHSDDYIAPLLVPRFIVPLIKLNSIRKLMRNRIFPKGIYEYAVVRTKYIDSEFGKSGENGFEQVVLFGAGFDTRGIRFHQTNPEVSVFELDAQITQTEKRRKLEKGNVTIPPNIQFIPIDFNIQSIGDRLKEFGFDFRRKTLFIMEGILMYLSEDAVGLLFRCICDAVHHGNEMIFDYVHRSAEETGESRYGVDEACEYVENAGEEVTFCLEDENLEPFLDEYGLVCREHLDAGTLNERFFSDNSGQTGGMINGACSIIRAMKRS